MSRRTAFIVALVAGGTLLATHATRSDGGPRLPWTLDCAAPRVPRGLIVPAKGVPRPPPTLILGLSANLRGQSGGARCAAEAVTRAIGVRWLREDLSWATAEPSRGVFRWGRFDAVIHAAAEHGIRLLPILDDTPSWATTGDGNALPTDPADFAAFANDAAVRYGPGGQFWRAHPEVARYAPSVLEVYNEPYWNGVDPAAYAALVDQAATAVRSSNPAVSLLAAVNPGPWLDGLYAADPAIFRDSATAGASVHPYALAPPDAPPSPETERRVETVHATMAAHGDDGRGVWITEVGWPTCPVDPLDCVSEATQASDLRATLALAGTSWQPWLRALFVYGLRDSKASTPADKESYFGLFRSDGHPKPAVGVLAAAASRGARRASTR